jgi:hypothetical protein
MTGRNTPRVCIELANCCEVIMTAALCECSLYPHNTWKSRCIMRCAQSAQWDNFTSTYLYDESIWRKICIDELYIFFLYIIYQKKKD